jgi:hypothetical protein
MSKPTVKDEKPDREHLGPTGPAKMPPESKRGPGVERVHPGNVNQGNTPVVGPTPTDAPHGGARKLEKEVDKKRSEKARE